MKHIMLCCALVLTVFITNAQEQQREFSHTEGDTTYTMKMYFMCFLKAGPARDQDKEQAANIQKEHLAHIDKLAKAGQVLIAGPFGDDGEIRGILIFDVATLEEATKLASEDPAVKAGRLEVEIHPWWAAKGSVLK